MLLFRPDGAQRKCFNQIKIVIGIRLFSISVSNQNWPFPFARIAFRSSLLNQVVQGSPKISLAGEDSHNSDWLRIRQIDDQEGTLRPRSECGGRKVITLMSHSRHLSEFQDREPDSLDDFFCPTDAALACDIGPDFVEIFRGLRRDVVGLHSDPFPSVRLLSPPNTDSPSSQPPSRADSIPASTSRRS